MGCAASTASNDPNNGSKSKRKTRGSKKEGRGAHNEDDSGSVNRNAEMDRSNTDFDESVAPRGHRPHRGDDDYDDNLSEISSTDLGLSMVRAATAAPIGKGLDKEREDTEVDLDREFFVWDDASLDLVDMRSKASARKNMAAARNKTILSRGAVGADVKSGGAGGKGVAGSFVFNDFTIEDSATLDALSDSMRGNSMRRPKAHTPAHGHAQTEGSAVSVDDPAFGARPTSAAAKPDPARQVKPKRPPGDIRSFSLSTRIGHSSRVKCLAIAPGEREYVSCSNDDSIITYYDVRGSQELGIYSGHQDTVIHAVFSPCGKFLATTSRDNTLVLWDVVTQKAILTFEHGKVVICCAFSRSSKFIATGCQDKVCRLWECRRGRELVAFTQHEGIIIALSISPDEQHIVSASADKTLRIWTANKGRAKAVLRGHNHIILACNYNAAGDRIVSNDERSVRVWSAPQGQQLRAIMVDDVIKLRNPPPNKKQSWTLSCLAPKSFPRHIIVASNNRMVFVIDMDTGAEVLSVDTKAPVYCLAPGHRSLVAYGDSFGNVYFLKLEAFDEEEPNEDRPGGADWA